MSQKPKPYVPTPPCEHCGGLHFGSGPCPYRKPCDECGRLTVLACADCGIDSGGREIVHVCEMTACRDAHEDSRHARQNDKG